ncbi:MULTISPECIES: glycosyltransferase [Mycobacterium]|uniref:4,4'-diaponeurosporenoate glycosyltransferase n=1 Tax=Mycobacterium kiyosense TaxID=2871094 RepID=A0A9P3Q8X7_9MYCO|nr:MULTISPECIES: glycosyltransferase [Mycobacterium]BDB45457.1 glycosyl transferase [Mycobacterium kiyosense]BDE16913.1 glycosyl transferase [Mycobacterium sp. 20KCMC460]GLB84438.1 glycosyl transferase [Mycobacterium kiyosense]GLB91055.1 glycosyl transferase [Mycobacterium kiyosense]GLB96945.1 glycosyl transferase [Mycobacterium kiyosense]
MPTAMPPTYEQVAVVIPAHNERASLPGCLRAMVTAALCVHAPVTIVVVLDASDDDSSDLAGRYGPDVHFVRIDARNVGAARAAGFDYARTLCGTDLAAWYATTDADSTVEPDWLSRQLGCGAEMFLGLVRVADWRPHGLDVVRRYLEAYNKRVDGGHDHVHGANMGFSSRAYWAVGGFRSLSSDEDVDLVARFETAGYRIHRDTAQSVVTSARTKGRAPRGFARHLRSLTSAGRGTAVHPKAGEPA